MPDGPLFDDWFIRVTVAPGFQEGYTATISVAYANPERDATELLGTTVREAESIGEIVGRLVEAYLQTRKSGLTRELGAMRRARLLH